MMTPRNLIMIALVFGAGCGGRVTSLDDTTGANGARSTNPDHHDETAIGNSCEAPATSDPSYPYCRWEGASGYESFCEKSYDGWAYLNWHTDVDGSSYCSNDASCNTCSCFIGCSDAPAAPVACPLPETGTARPECLGPPTTMGTCMLTCDSGEKCPTGMRCVENNEYGRRVCAWVCSA